MRGSNQRTFRWWQAAAALCAALAASGAAAGETATCDAVIPRYERAHGIPVYLLSAIARNESGRWDKTQKKMVSWPWTLNAQGQGMYFNTKEEAVAAVQRLRLQGVSSIDVGCMQVNLHHHPKAFRSISDAFDPETNVGYAAKFLRQNFEESGSWKTAVMYYHSRTAMHGVPYAQRVLSTWRRIINGDRPGVMASLDSGRGGSDYYVRRSGAIASGKAGGKARDVMVIRVADRSSHTVRNVTVQATGNGLVKDFRKEYTEVKPASAQVAVPGEKPKASGPKIIRVGAKNNAQKPAARTTPVDFIFD